MICSDGYCHHLLISWKRKVRSLAGNTVQHEISSQFIACVFDFIFQPLLQDVLLYVFSIESRSPGFCENHSSFSDSSSLDTRLLPFLCILPCMEQQFHLYHPAYDRMQWDTLSMQHLPSFVFVRYIFSEASNCKSRKHILYHTEQYVWNARYLAKTPY